MAELTAERSQLNDAASAAVEGFRQALWQDGHAVKPQPGQRARGKWRPDLGFEVWARSDPALDAWARRGLAERFVSEVIERNRLVCGGGLFGPGARRTELSVLVVKEGTYASCSNRDRDRVKRWLAKQREITEHRVGALISTGSDRGLQDRTRPPRARGANNFERALRLRGQAIAAYRDAAEVLSGPEIQDAVSKLERSAELVAASVDEAAKVLYRRLGLSKRGHAARDRLWELRNFIESDWARETRPRRRRRSTSFWHTKLGGALFDVADLERQEVGVIDIPDMHELERKLVRGSRVAIDEIGKLLNAGKSLRAQARLASESTSRSQRTQRHAERVKPR